MKKWIELNLPTGKPICIRLDSILSITPFRSGEEGIYSENDNMTWVQQIGGDTFRVNIPYEELRDMLVQQYLNLNDNSNKKSSYFIKK